MDEKKYKYNVLPIARYRVMVIVKYTAVCYSNYTSLNDDDDAMGFYYLPLPPRGGLLPTVRQHPSPTHKP